MKDFEILFKEGGFIAGDFLNIKIWKIDPKKYPRRKYPKDDLKIGFVVGIKVSKSAVKRNLIKRRMREVVRLLLKEKKIKSGYMIAVLAKADILDCEYAEIEKAIMTVFKRARLLYEN